MARDQKKYTPNLYYRFYALKESGLCNTEAAKQLGYSYSFLNWHFTDEQRDSIKYLSSQIKCDNELKKSNLCCKSTELNKGIVRKLNKVFRAPVIEEDEILDNFLILSE